MRVFLIFATVLFGGCYANPIVTMDTSKAVLVDYPDIGAIRDAHVGETVAAKGAYRAVQQLEIVEAATFGKEEGEASVWNCGYTIAPSTAKQRGVFDKVWRGQEISASCFGPLLAALTESDGATSGNCRGQTIMIDVCQDDLDASYFLVNPDHPAGKVVLPLKQDFDNFRVTDVWIKSSENALHDVTYSGRSGNTVELVYRKFSGDSERPDITTELDFDLSESPQIQYRDLVIEVIEATNTSIKYRLLGNFSD